MNFINDNTNQHSVIPIVEALEDGATATGQANLLSNPLEGGGRLISYGANFEVIGKTDPGRLSYAGAWEEKEGTLTDLADHICQGHPWMPGLLGGNEKRWQSNVNYIELLTLDIDSGWHIKEALSDSKIKDWCGLGIESASSTSEHHKFRLVFRLVEPICEENLAKWGWEGKPHQLIRVCNQYLQYLFPVADPACKDASRFFFGAPDRQPFLLNEDAYLPEDFILKAIAWYEQIDKEERRKAEAARQQWEKWRSQHSEDDTKALILQALDCIDPDCPYNDWIAIGMALAGMGDSWFNAWDNWSAGGSSYNPKVTAQKWKSFRGKAASPGTIFGIAKRYGWQFPKKEWKDPREPDPVAYQEYLEREQVQAQAQQAQETEDFITWLKGRLAGLGKQCLKGFGIKTKQAQSITVELPETINWEPGQPVPTPVNYQGEKTPKITFKKGDRLKLIAALIQAGWNNIVDKSRTGNGKSHELGQLANSEGKTYYFDTNHRNPSTVTIESNFVDLPVRHGGLFIDETRHTALGNPFQVWQGDRDSERTPANCNNSEIFNAVRKRGYELPEANPICDNCRFQGICHTQEGHGFGFKHQKQEAMAHQAIRANLDSINPDGDYGLPDAIAIVEEATAQIKGTATIETTWGDLLVQFDSLEDKHPEIATDLAPVKKSLRILVTGDAAQTNAEKRWGLSHDRVLEVLGHHEISPDAIAAASDLVAFESLIEEPDSVSGCGGDYYTAGKIARSYLARETKEQNKQRVEQLPANALPHLLTILSGSNGALRFKDGKLSITYRDNRHARILSQTRANILLDATPNIPLLLKRLNITESELVVIEQESAPLDNLNVYVVDLPGMRSGQWSDSCKERIEKLIASLTKAHRDLVTLGLKPHQKDLKFNGYWFRDNRGQNEWKGKGAIAAFGSPYINVGAAQDEYLTLYGTLDGFAEHYERLTQNEIVQFIGRPRAHLSPDQHFHIYLVGTDLDASFLESLGVNLIYQDAYEINPEATTRRRQDKWKIWTAAQELFRTGKKLTQQALADATELSQGWIAKQFGGSEILSWSQFKQLFQSLYSSKRKWNNFQSELDESFRAWLELPPADLVREVADYAQNNGWQGLEELLGMLAPETAFRVLGVVAIALPNSLNIFESSLREVAT